MEAQMQDESQTALAATPLSNEELNVALITNYGEPTFYGDALFDTKARTAFIKGIVSTVRKCPEYARYRTFILENLDMSTCSILSNLTPEEVSAAGLEIHHAPLALYDIVELVLGQMQVDRVRLTTFAVANRVMAYHWKGMVGLVPLVQMLHEAVHAGQLHVDPRSIFGNWQGLIDENRAGLTEHLADKIRAIALSWDSDAAKEQNAKALKINLQRWTAIPVTRANLLAPPTEAPLPSEEAL
jgi:hypothetical protein